MPLLFTPAPQLAEEYSCGYCLRNKYYMNDPRELPCSHIFCLSCLQDDFRNMCGEPITCKVCGSMNDVRDLEGLQRPTSKGIPESMGIEENIPLCDVCHNGTSVCFCKDCQQRFCEIHLKNHEELGLDHHIVALEQYRNQSTEADSLICSGHRHEEVIKICGKCSQRFCIKCRTQTVCNSSSAINSLHKLYSVEAIGLIWREELETDVQVLHEKMLEFKKHELKAKEAFQNVQERVAEQAGNKRNKDSETKRLLENHLTETRGVVEQYVSEGEVAIEELQAVEIAVKEYCASQNVQIVQWRESIRDKLKDVWSMKPKPLKSIESYLKAYDENPNIKMIFVKTPHPPMVLLLNKYLTLHCRSVCFTNAGKLAACSQGYVTLLECSSNLRCANTIELADACSIVSCGSGYAVMSCYERDCMIQYYSQDLRPGKLIDGYAQTIEFQSLATCENQFWIAAVDNNLKLIKFYTDVGEFIFEAKIPDIETTAGIHTLPDGTILLSNMEGGCVNRYRVEDKSLKLVWSCTGLVKPTVLCSDDEGYIYVGSAAGSVISIISEYGGQVTEMFPDELLGATIADLSIDKDLLAVACLETGIITFKILR